MAQNKDSVYVAVEGDIYSYPTSTPAPTAINTPVPETATTRGYLTEDGVSYDEQVSSTTITAWQGTTLVRTIKTEGSVEISLASLQIDDANLEWWVGKPKSTDGGFEYNPTETGGKQSYDLFAYDLGTRRLVRIYVPEAEITSRDTLQFVSTGAATLGATLTAYKSDTLGYTYKIWEGEIPEGLEDPEDPED